MAEGWIDSDLPVLRSEIDRRIGPHVAIEFEECTRSEFNRKQVYQVLIGDVGVFKSRNDKMGIVTYAIAHPAYSETDEEYGTLNGALNRVVEILVTERNVP